MRIRGILSLTAALGATQRSQVRFLQIHAILMTPSVQGISRILYKRV